VVKLSLNNENIPYTYMQSSVNRNISKTEEGNPTVLLHTSFRKMENSLGYNETELPLPEQIVELLGKLYNIYYAITYSNIKPVCSYCFV